MNNLIYAGSAILIVILIFVVFRHIVHKDYMRKGKLTIRSAASEWILILSWVYFTYTFQPIDWPAIHVSIYEKAIGWIFIIIGLLFFFYSLLWLGIKRSHGLKPDRIMQSGPYKFSRNPQIVGFCLSFIGYVLLWQSWYMLGSLVLLFLFSHVMVITEEEHLRDSHGNNYRQYCKRVPRYLGIPKIP